MTIVKLTSLVSVISLSELLLVGQRMYAQNHFGVYRSDDAGATWTPAHAGLAKLYSQTVIADRTRSGRVLIGTETNILTDGRPDYDDDLLAACRQALDRKGDRLEALAGDLG